MRTKQRFIEVSLRRKKESEYTHIEDIGLPNEFGHKTLSSVDAVYLFFLNVLPQTPAKDLHDLRHVISQAKIVTGDLIIAHLGYIYVPTTLGQYRFRPIEA